MPEGKSKAKTVLTKLRVFWSRNEQKIVFLAGLVLVAAISFEFGLLQGQKWLTKPLIIEKTAHQEACAPSAASNTDSPRTALKNDLNASLKNASAVRTDCPFVGSKNSNKYHLPNCQWAKRIKPENVVCFKSAEDAAAKNYQPDKGCIK